jgi:hypothetical protein
MPPVLHAADVKSTDLVNPKPSTFCNPLNLDYKIQADHAKEWYREAVDPVALFFQANG